MRDFMTATTSSAHIDALYRNHHDWLRVWLQHRLRNAGDAADLAQDTFVRLLVSGRLPSPAQSRAFLVQVAKGLSVDLHRRRAVEAAYLAALAQPSRWSLASILDDVPVRVSLPGGRSWEPKNYDGRHHGEVLLVETVEDVAGITPRDPERLAGIEEGDTLFVERGDSFLRVLDKLREAGVEDGHRSEWQLLARRLDAGGRLQVGEYALEPGMSATDLLLKMREGRVIRHRFTIVEGWNIRELRAALASASPLLHEAGGLDDGALMEALGRPGVHPEGRFLPETYLYTRGDTDLDLLGRAAAALDEVLEEAWASRDEGLPLDSAEEALVLASIIEKETGIPAERGKIAGVFTRRLQRGMRLQTDPTVIYGIGSAFDGNIRRRDLQTDTPYNTYTRDGLPPTPIAMAGAAASMATKQAAMSPAIRLTSWCMLLPQVNAVRP